VTVIGLDDTDSREEGMCTTFVAHRVAERLRERGRVERLLLVRLNPAVEHKTRGNAALAVHTDVPADEAFAVAREVVGSAAVESDPNTNPGVVVAAGAPDATVGPHDAVVRFARSAVRDHLAVADAEALLDHAGFHAEGWGNGRGRVGALAAVGAWAAGLDGGSATADTTSPDGATGPAAPDATTDRVFGDWTHEHVAYRERERWGTPRDVDADSVFAAADDAYPTVWDTVDRGEDETVCVPHTPGPVLYGIRGDDPGAVRDVAAAIESEPAAASETFLTNQGTDAHLQSGDVADALDGRAYRLDGVVASAPETRRGGHVFFDLAGVPALDTEDPSTADATAPGATDSAEPADGNAAVPDDAPTLRCAAFEPTKRFRDRVRALRVGDRLTVCGEVGDGTVKLEKVAVRSLVTTERVAPDCPACGRRMESAGRGQGYRCRDCSTATDGRVERSLDRSLDPGWYEVPPCARRHVAKPLVRGGFDAPTHPER
jgi:tRNA(Ile2)-agmatinylcytidine synthase